MAIFRGDGGSGDSTTDAYASQVAQDANTASTKASEAAASATAAASSASNAATSESNASSSETNAASSASSAASSATDSATSATASATSATNAATSESNASTSATNAANSATAASTSATNSATSATNAANSASAASTSATNAATSETNAANSATAAATSATNASTSATNASTSATNAATSATSAAASYDSFDDRYLGTKGSDPSLDNDGDSLVTGALYYNTSVGEMRVYTGSSWLAAYIPATGYLQLSGGTLTGALTLNADPSTNLQAATKQYVDTIAAASLHYHDPVRVEKEGNLSATYNNGSSGVGATLTNNSTQEALVIDGVTLSLNDRVLIYEQTDATQNGIYTVTDTGSASTNWVLTRATDADSYAPSDPDSFGEGDAFFVLEGTLGAGELYVMNTSGTITFGTTNITFAQVSSAQVYTAGTGISISGAEISTTALLNVVEDTTPQLGGALSANGYDINMGTYTITDTKVGQWDTAYSWGDHSTAGYLTSFSETDTLDSVTGRGATTSNAVTVGNLTSTGIDDNATSTAITIDSSQNVGIGLNNNTYSKLGSYGATTLPALGAGGWAATLGNTTSPGYGVCIATDTDGIGYIQSQRVDGTATSYALVLQPNGGNVGIGTTSPSGALDVRASNYGLVFSPSFSSTVGTLTFTNGGTRTSTIKSTDFGASLVLSADTQQGNSSTNIIFETDASERMRIDSSGNVGIGTTSADASVHISSNFPILKLDNTDTILSNGQTVAEIQFKQNDSTGGGTGIVGRIKTISRPRVDSGTYFGNAADLSFFVSADSAGGASENATKEALTIQRGTGNVGISTSSPSEKLNVSGNILATGNITAYSDERLKSDVETLDGSKVYEMRGVSFTKDGEASSGVIAQELQKVAPELVNDSGEYLSVAYGNLVGYLIEAVKELKAEIEELKNGSSD